MNRRSISLAASFLLILGGARADTLEQVLAHLDANAKTFKSFTAKFTQTDYENVLGEAGADHSGGTVSMQESKNSLTGTLIYDDGHVDFFDGRAFNIYYPKVKDVEIYNLEKDTSQLLKLILLGFGTTRADLLKEFNVSLGGPESIGGQAATRIVLKPKTEKQKQYMSEMALWISDSTGYPLQEKIIQPSKNYSMLTYSGMQVPAPAGTLFEFNVPPGTKKVYPGK